MALAQQSDGLDVTVSSTVVEPGGFITVAGSGCAPNVEVTITSGIGPGGLIDDVVADGSGAFTDNFDFPAELVEGVQNTEINVFCVDADGNQQTFIVDIFIQAGELPFTGVPTRPLFLGVAGHGTGVPNGCCRRGGEPPLVKRKQPKDQSCRD